MNRRSLPADVRTRSPIGTTEKAASVVANWIHLRHTRLQGSFIATRRAIAIGNPVETQLSADAAPRTIGRQAANPLGQVDTALRWQSTTWPRSRGLNDHEGLDAVPQLMVRS